MSFGENLRSARKKLGLTQEELGDKLSMAPQTVSKWERGESMPDAALLVPLANVLQTSIDRLFDRKITEYHDAASAAASWLLTVNGRERWQAAMRLGRIIQTVLGGLWEKPEIITPTPESFDDLHLSSGAAFEKEGFSLGSWKNELSYLTFFPEPETGWEGAMGRDNPEFWEALSMEEVRRTLRLLYSRDLPDFYDRDYFIDFLELKNPEQTLPALERLEVVSHDKTLLDGEEREIYSLCPHTHLLQILLLGSSGPAVINKFTKKQGLPLHGHVIT